MLSKTRSIPSASFAFTAENQLEVDNFTLKMERRTAKKTGRPCSKLSVMVANFLLNQAIAGSRLWAKTGTLSASTARRAKKTWKARAFMRNKENLSAKNMHIASIKMLRIKFWIMLSKPSLKKK